MTKDHCISCGEPLVGNYGKYKNGKINPYNCAFCSPDGPVSSKISMKRYLSKHPYIDVWIFKNLTFVDSYTSCKADSVPISIPGFAEENPSLEEAKRKVPINIKELMKLHYMPIMESLGVMKKKEAQKHHILAAGDVQVYRVHLNTK
jgi:hypothetical protein